MPVPHSAPVSPTPKDKADYDDEFKVHVERVIEEMVRLAKKFEPTVMKELRKCISIIAILFSSVFTDI